MTQETFKCSCDYTCSSAYALKKHKRYCTETPERYMPSSPGFTGTRNIPFNGPRGTLAKRQGFTEPYVKPMTADSVSAALHPLRRGR